MRLLYVALPRCVANSLLPVVHCLLPPRLSAAVATGVGAMTWSPLACGIITGKYENGIPESCRASMKVRGLIFVWRSRQFVGKPANLFPSTGPQLQSYQWLKEKIISEDGRKQQAKLKELGHLTEKLCCTLPQLAVGENSQLNQSLIIDLLIKQK